MMQLNFAAIVLVAALCGSGAMAAEIANLDEESQTVTVIAGEDQLEYTIPPTQSLDLGEICVNGCSVVLQNGQDYELAADDVASIEAGDLKLGPVDQGADFLKNEQEESEPL